MKIEIEISFVFLVVLAMLGALVVCLGCDGHGAFRLRQRQLGRLDHVYAERHFAAVHAAGSAGRPGAGFDPATAARPARHRQRSTRLLVRLRRQHGLRPAQLSGHRLQLRI